MGEQQFTDFLTAFGEEFAEALSPVVGWDLVVPQDGHELFLRPFEQNPSPASLAVMTDTDFERHCARSTCGMRRDISHVTLPSENSQLVVSTPER